MHCRHHDSPPVQQDNVVFLCVCSASQSAQTELHSSTTVCRQHRHCRLPLLEFLLHQTILPNVSEESSGRICETWQQLDVCDEDQLSSLWRSNSSGCPFCICVGDHGEWWAAILSGPLAHTVALRSQLSTSKSCPPWVPVIVPSTVTSAPRIVAHISDAHQSNWPINDRSWDRFSVSTSMSWQVVEWDFFSRTLWT